MSWSLKLVHTYVLSCINFLCLSYSFLQIIDPENAAKIDNIVSQLTKCRNGEMKFTLILDDSSGNSFIENPLAPEEDPMMTVVHYTRKPEQDAKLGIAPAVEEEEKEEKEEEGGTDLCPLNIA